MGLLRCANCDHPWSWHAPGCNSCPCPEWKPQEAPPQPPSVFSIIAGRLRRRAAFLRREATPSVHDHHYERQHMMADVFDEMAKAVEDES